MLIFGLESHTLLIFVHLVLFVYWLGPDWGVYVTTHFICKPGLSIEERRRFLAAMLRIDLVPRSCLILLFPVGLTLSDGLGMSPVTGNWLIVVWVFFLVWLLLSWTVYLNKGPENGNTFRKIDNGIRWIVAPTLILIGAASITMDIGFGTNWLALKVMLFGILIFLGLWLRSFVGELVTGFQRLNTEGSTPEVEAVFTNMLSRSKRVVYLFWGTSLVLAFLGLTKPF
ncbi:MAG: hypothetical protein RIF37_17775 [Rhodospirillaceae bacterium]